MTVKKWTTAAESMIVKNLDWVSMIDLWCVKPSIPERELEMVIHWATATGSKTRFG